MRARLAEAERLARNTRGHLCWPLPLRKSGIQLAWEAERHLRRPRVSATAATARLPAVAAA
jgi:hypothetical protein